MHGAVVMVADLVGIGSGGVLAYYLTGSVNQVWLQLPVAVVVTIALSGLWMAGTRLRRLAPLQPRSANELAWCLVASLVWGIVVFVPVHYATQGYVTGLGNTVALALYQLLVNTVALFGSVAIVKPPLWQQPEAERAPARPVEPR